MRFSLVLSAIENHPVTGYGGNSLLATIAGSAVTYHYPDQLSNRLETDGSGNVVRTFGHLPFGDLWYETGTADKWKFTGYERDNPSGESGLDYALNRFYSSTYGRFQSPDLLDGNPGNPQSWNRYAYVLNDPANFVDPLGLFYSNVPAPNPAPGLGGFDNFDTEFSCALFGALCPDSGPQPVAFAPVGGGGGGGGGGTPKGNTNPCKSSGFGGGILVGYGGSSDVGLA